MKRLFTAIILLCVVLTGCAQPSPQPAAEEAAATGDTVTLRVDCSTILANMDKLERGKESLVPEDGAILAATEVRFTPGETVFDIAARELKARNIHHEFSSSPMSDTAYMEGIGNIYEFDCGELSGWEYSVNGEFPSVGCGKYEPEPGDEIAFLYTCDLGADLGGIVKDE